MISNAPKNEIANNTNTSPISLKTDDPTELLITKDITINKIRLQYNMPNYKFSLFTNNKFKITKLSIKKSDETEIFSIENPLKLKSIYESRIINVPEESLYSFIDIEYNFDELNNFGNFNMPMWWATVMMFRRDPEVEMLFNAMNMIKQNWQHYRNLYKISKSTYRNDFALSIALGIIHGHTLDLDDAGAVITEAQGRQGAMEAGADFTGAEIGRAHV